MVDVIKWNHGRTNGKVSERLRSSNHILLWAGRYWFSSRPHICVGFLQLVFKPLSSFSNPSQRHPWMKDKEQWQKPERRNSLAFLLYMHNIVNICYLYTTYLKKGPLFRCVFRCVCSMHTQVEATGRSDQLTEDQLSTKAHQQSRAGEDHRQVQTQRNLGLLVPRARDGWSRAGAGTGGPPEDQRKQSLHMWVLSFLVANRKMYMCEIHYTFAVFHRKFKISKKWKYNGC